MFAFDYRFGRSLTITMKRNTCRFSINIPQSAWSGVNLYINIPDSMFRDGLVLALTLWLHFVSNVSRFKIFPPWFHFGLTSCWWYRLGKFQYGIRLNNGKASIWNIWFRQIAANSFWCSILDWATLRKRTRSLSSFHKSLIFFTTLLESCALLETTLRFCLNFCDFAYRPTAGSD